MESKAFKTVLHTLTSFSIKLKVIETAAVRNGQTLWIIASDPSNQLSKVASSEHIGTDYRELLSSYLKSFLAQKCYSSAPETVCTLFHRFGRSHCSAEDVRDIINNKTSLNNLSQIQICRFEPSRHYSYSLAYLNKRYQTRYCAKDTSGQMRPTKKDFCFSVIADIAKTVVSAMERSELKRMIKLTVECCRDPNDEI